LYTDTKLNITGVRNLLQF